MYRIGSGYDLHRLEEGEELILAGVRVPYEKGLAGHSDADVVCHAVTDALLGALAKGDIGSHFPDDDAAYKGADSQDLLRKVMKIVDGADFKVNNLDLTIIAERPKLQQYIPAMRENLAECLEVRVNQVSVKAKTNEGVGPEGRGEAVSVHASVLLQAQHA